MKNGFMNYRGGDYHPIKLPGNFSTINEMWQELQAARKTAAVLVDRRIADEQEISELEAANKKLEDGLEQLVTNECIKHNVGLYTYNGKEGLKEKYKQWGLDAVPLSDMGKKIDDPFWDKERTADDWRGIFSLLREKRRFEGLWDKLFTYVAFTTIPNLDVLKSKAWGRKTSRAIGDISDNLKNFIADLFPVEGSNG